MRPHSHSSNRVPSSPYPASEVWEAIQTSDHPLLTSPQLPGGYSGAVNGRVERLWAGLGEMLGDI